MSDTGVDPWWNRGPRDVEPLFTVRTDRRADMGKSTGRDEAWVPG